MSEYDGAGVPAGWYPDPSGSGRQRWWNGTSWSEYTDQWTYTGAGSSPVDRDVNTNTPWIWVIVFLPILGVLPLLTIDWSDYVSAIVRSRSEGYTGSGALMASPGYLISALSGWVIFGIGVWFSYLDRRELTRRGIPRTFHWAWAFLGAFVYVIGRSVLVRRATGRGLAPMWVAITLAALSLIGGLAFTIWLVSSILNAMQIGGYIPPHAS
ncbi:DUF2510 domain-containing protein [Rathayibacter sp. YIM 133350]|uniref:DUF2510 domain-containing protein n=1 Tax=Rathayibacter sp. YIM 133350 TaxID=3131992 RepID=UPI00307E214E